MKKFFILLFLIFGIIVLNVNHSQCQWETLSMGWAFENSDCLGYNEKYIYSLGGADGWYKYFRSSDNGNTWEKFGTPADRLDILEVRDSIIFMGEIRGENLGSSGVYYSSDYGNSWKYIGLYNRALGSLLYVESKLFVGQWDNMLVTTDLGDNWKNIGIPSSFLQINQDIIFACSYKTLSTSTDKGSSWNTKSIEPIMRCMAIGKNIIVIGTDEDVFISTDNGDNWISKNMKDHGWINALAVVGDNIFVATSNDGVFLSSNKGDDWKRINMGLNNYFSTIKSFLIKGDYIFASGDGAIAYRAKLNDFQISPVETISFTKFDIQIEPNPAEESFKIYFKNDNTQENSLVIYDMLGNKVQSFEIGYLPDEKIQLNVDAKNFSSGVYYCVLKINGLYVTEKIIINK